MKISGRIKALIMTAGVIYVMSLMLRACVVRLNRDRLRTVRPALRHPDHHAGVERCTSDKTG